MTMKDLTKTNSEAPIQRPRAQDYLDAKQYLRDVYEWRKNSIAGFSFAAWADELGFKSRSFVRMILMGKRSITAAAIPLFIQGMEMDRAEADYFEKLVNFNQAPNVEAREHYARQLERHTRQNSTRSLVQDHYAFVSSQHGPRLLALLELKDCTRTAESLAQLLGLRVAEVRNLLDLLLRLGMAKREPNTNDEATDHWSATTPGFEIKNSYGDTALQTFHRKSLEEASSAINLPVNTRHFQSMIVPVSEEEYQIILQETYKFYESLFARFNSENGDGRRLYQINLNLIPVSKPILRADKSPRAPMVRKHADPSASVSMRGNENEATP